MTVLALQVAVSAGDSQMGSIANDSGKNVTASATVSTNSTLLQPGSHGNNDEYSVACRFPSATIPQGSTINSATFTLRADSTYSAGGNVIRYHVSCQAADNAGALVATSGDLRASVRPRTTASAVWTQTSVTGNTEYSVDITSAVQEVINRAGWVSGNAIVVLVDTHADCTSGEWQDYRAYDSSASTAPKLSVDYSTGGSPQTITPAGVASAEAFGGSTLAAGAVSVAPAGVASAEAFGAAAVLAGGALVAPAGIASGEGFGVAVLAAGAVSVAPAGVSSVEAFGSAELAAVATIAPAGIASGEAVGIPVLPGATSNYSVQVGDGYSDVSPKQLVRTAGNVLYMIAINCDIYPDFTATGLTQTVRVHRANSTGVPSGFTRKDSANEPAGAVTVAAAIDGDDQIHIVWVARSSVSNARYLRYAVFDTASDTWGAVATIASDLDYDDIGQGDQACALALDADGVPHVVYLGTAGSGTLANRRVYYRNRIGGSWSSATQVDSGVSYTGNQKAWHANLAFDSAGRLLVLWLRGTFNDTADGTIYCRVYAGTWGSTVAVSSVGGALTSIDQSTSILITAGGRYHTAFINASTTHSEKYIRYRYSDDQGATWSANDPASGLQATHNPSLGWTGSKIRIMGHGTPDGSNHGQNLYFFEGDGGSASWGTWTQFVAGTNFDSSVNARWSQFFHHYPATLDVAYWNDNYPNVLYTGTEVFALNIAPVGVASAEAFGGAVLASVVTIAPAGIASGFASDNQLLSPGAVAILAAGIASAEVFGAVVLAAGGVTLAPAGVASAEGFGTAAVLPGEVAIAAVGIASVAGFGAATVLPGAATVAPAGVASGEGFGAAAVLPGGVTIAAAGVASGEAVGDALVNAGGTVVQVAGIASAEAFGLATLVPGGVVVLAAGVASAEGFGAALVAAGGTVVQATGIGSAEGFGLALVAAGAAMVLPAGVASAEGFGDAAILPGGVVVLAEGVATGEGFGGALLALGGATVAPAGIGSGEVFGDAAILPGAVTIAPAGVASGEAFGLALVTGLGLPQFVMVSGIGSGEAFGVLMLLLQLVASRTMSIEREGRTVSVVWENRTVVAGTENRTVVIRGG